MTEHPGDRLDSWKEIARYMDRGVRTVRRWEHDEGMPVHRHVHGTLGSVYAFKSELDAWRRAGSSAPRGAAPAGHPAIAVLPFANLSTDPENAYLADGLSEEITADLAGVRALRVVSRRSAARISSTAKDAQAVAAQLGVRYLVEGSVRRAGDQLRITARLVDAPADETVWAGKYSGPVDDVFEMQERLARTIVRALALQLTPEEDRRLATRPIDHLRAYECYLQARQDVWRWRKDSLDHAVRLLRAALDMIGDNATLYAALGFAELQYREAGIDTTDGPLHAAERCADRVSALEPSSAASRQLRGWIDYARGRIQDAVRQLKAALDADPNNADTLLLLSNCYLISGRVHEARPLLNRLLTIDPLTPLNRCMPAFADLLEGRASAALAPYRQMLAMDPANPMARLFYVWVLVLNARADEAGAVIREFPSQAADSVPARLAAFLHRCAAGEGAAAAALISPQVAAATAVSDVFPRFLAEGCAVAGMLDEAVTWLQRAVDRGFINHPFLAHHDPLLAPLRGHPRFAEILEQVRRRWEQFEA